MVLGRKKLNQNDEVERYLADGPPGIPPLSFSKADLRRHIDRQHSILTTLRGLLLKIYSQQIVRSSRELSHYDFEVQVVANPLNDNFEVICPQMKYNAFVSKANVSETLKTLFLEWKDIQESQHA